MFNKRKQPFKANSASAFDIRVKIMQYGRVVITTNLRKRIIVNTQTENRSNLSRYKRWVRLIFWISSMFGISFYSSEHTLSKRKVTSSTLVRSFCIFCKKRKLSLESVLFLLRLWLNFIHILRLQLWTKKQPWMRAALSSDGNSMTDYLWWKNQATAPSWMGNQRS